MTLPIASEQARTILLLSVLVGISCGVSEDPLGPLIAHRGASAYAPEHTLDAYRLALQQGADYVEQDLQLTRDGVLICLHDRSLERTTNVEELFPDRYREVEMDGQTVRSWLVSDMTLAEIQSLDAGSWFGSGFAGSRVPTFQEAIDLISGQAGLFPELKNPGGYRQLGHDMENLVVEVLRENRLLTTNPPSPVILQTFDADSARRLRKLVGQQLKIVLLLADAGEKWTTDEGLRELAEFATGLGPYKEIVRQDPTIVSRAHQLGLTVTPYTFRASDVGASFRDVSHEMGFYRYQLGVDALFTDNPDLFPRQPATRRENPAGQ